MWINSPYLSYKSCRTEADLKLLKLWYFQYINYDNYETPCSDVSKPFYRDAVHDLTSRPEEVSLDSVFVFKIQMLCWSGITAHLPSMEIAVAKILCLLGVFALMLGGILIPVRMMHMEYDKITRYRRVVALSNCFGGGVFLATCFNALLPAVRAKVCHQAWFWSLKKRFTQK